jgi:virginiamycin A acetyltransferase
MMNTFLILLKNVVRRFVDKVSPKFMARNPRYKMYQVGDWTYGYPNIYSWGEGATFTIGKYCSIAPDVIILLGGEHRTDWVTTYPFNYFWKAGKLYTGHPATKGDVVIGNDVWIGRGALIRSGVKIGDGAVIGANSVVTKNVPAYTVVAGNPAANIKLRFPAEQVTALERMAWWNWPEEKIAEALPLLLSNNISDFIGKYSEQ